MVLPEIDISDSTGASSSAAAKARTFASLIELKHEHLLRTGKPRRPSNEGGLRAQRRQLGPEDFETLGVLGRGAFAEVTLAKKRDTGAVYAVKRMRKADLVSRGHVERAWTEWMVQSEADGNEWLVKLHFCFQTAEHVYLVMDYVPGGDMMGLFMRLDTLPEADAKFYAAQTVRAIESLHRLGYAHRDIKPDNLLLDASGHLKLADLGLAKCTVSQLRKSEGGDASSRRSECDENETPPVVSPVSATPASTTAAASASAASSAASSPTRPPAVATPPTAAMAGVSITSPVTAPSATASPNSAASAPGSATASGGRHGSRETLYSRVGTPDYMAPEVLTRSGYGVECDWWSFGCILFEMLVGYAPFYAESAQETADKVLRHKETLVFPPEASLSNEARSLITALLTTREERIGLPEIKAHPFFTGVDWEGLRDSTPPHTPTILSETDTQHFEEFEPVPAGTPATLEPVAATTPPPSQLPRDDKAVLFAGFQYKRVGSS